MLKKENERIDWIDCAKGIAIFLVIIGHTLTVHDLVRGFIFSFHMPLFFIFSGMLMHFSDDIHVWKKKQLRAAYSLILPAIVVWALRSIIYIVHNYASFDIQSLISYIKTRIIILFWGSGSVVTVSDKTVEALGMMWFLIVLFVAKGIYDFLHLCIHSKFCFTAITIVLGVMGVVIGSVQWLPLSFDLVLVAMLFLLIGQTIQIYLQAYKKGIINIGLGIFNFVIYLISFVFVYHFTGIYLELAGRRYPLFPLCVVTAVAGTIALGGFCLYIRKIPYVGNALCIVGRHSLAMLCIHMMDYLAAPVYNYVSSNEFVIAFIRIIIDIVIFVIYFLLKNIQQKMQIMKKLGKEEGMR